MTKKVFKDAKCNISLDWFKLLGGLIMIIAGIVGYKFKDKNKYYALGGVVSGVAGLGLIITELEDNFKPIEDNDESESDK